MGIANFEQVQADGGTSMTDYQTIQTQKEDGLLIITLYTS